LGICKSAANGGGFRWVWDKQYWNKYNPGHKEHYRIWSPVGRLDLTATTCAILRSPKEGKFWKGGFDGKIDGRPSAAPFDFAGPTGLNWGGGSEGEEFVGNGVCNDARIFGNPHDLNTEAYGYDGGDCCSFTNPLSTTDQYCRQPACGGLRTASGFGAWSACVQTPRGCGGKKKRTCIHPNGSANEFNFCFADNGDMSRENGLLVQTAQCTNSELPATFTPCIWQATGVCPRRCNPSTEKVAQIAINDRTCVAGAPGRRYLQQESCTTLGTIDNQACPTPTQLCTWNTDDSNGSPIWDRAQCSLGVPNPSEYQFCNKVQTSANAGRGPVDGGDALSGGGDTKDEERQIDDGGDVLTLFSSGSYNNQYDEGPWSANPWGATLPPTGTARPLFEEAISQQFAEELNPGCPGATHLINGVWLVKKRSCYATV